ncbi:hypothetical protein QBC45DRAFT_209537 [Copromyces sp. CBS 386.78]|nr:hypothetical protein QBC45DRAFT_209537 [Copromyces sp. CBS 386.78]
MAHQIPPHYVPNHTDQYAQGQQPYSQGQQTHAQGQPEQDQYPNWADGLEVVPHEHLNNTQHWPEVRQEEVGKELSPATAAVNEWKWRDERHQYNASQAPEVVDGPAPVKPNRKRLWIILGTVLAVIIIVAAVVGGVVGSKAARDSKASTAPVLDGDGGSSSAIPSPSQTTTGGAAAPTSTGPVAGAIKSGSPLTLASWRNDKDKVGLYLFYQDKTNNVYYVKYDGSSWGKPVSTITGLKRGTKLTAAVILNGVGNTARPHVILTYIGPGPTVLAKDINENNIPTISNDDDFIENMGPLDALANSSTASYFPAAVYQTPSGELGQARVIMLRWSAKPTGIMALPGTNLAMVPISTRWAMYAASGGYGVIYQDPDGRLAASVPDLGPDDSVDAVAPWFNSSIFPTDITPPNGAPLAAWVTRRPNFPPFFPNTYILYLDSDSSVKMVYTSFSGDVDESVTWKTSEPEALKGLDKDTGIGCVLMASINADQQNRIEIPIEQDSEEVNRCFFQKGGKLVEARMSGGAAGSGDVEWKIVGEVPLPT